MHDRQIRGITMLDIEDPVAVIKEIKSIAHLAYADFDDGPIDQAWADLDRLFRGEYPGYRRSNVSYHNLGHTLAVTLAVTRLMHGALDAGHALPPNEFCLGVISGFMHDTGYIQLNDDTEGTGAKYTLTHIERSIKFVRQYYQDDPVFRDEIPNFKDILHCTGLNTKIDQIRFANDRIKLLGQMLGTADLLGQMADRCYLEKLLNLYNEFVEAGIKTYASPLDLLEKTPAFYHMTLGRFSKEFKNVYHFARRHFRKRWNIDENLYMKRIQSNMVYLEFVLAHNREDYKSYLRRSV
jgi:hypothetical protein